MAQKADHFWKGVNNDHPYLNRSSVVILGMSLITALAVTALFFTQAQFIAFAAQFPPLHFWAIYYSVTTAAVLLPTSLFLALFFQNKDKFPTISSNLPKTQITSSLSDRNSINVITSNIKSEKNQNDFLLDKDRDYEILQEALIATEFLTKAQGEAIWEQRAAFVFKIAEKEEYGFYFVQPPKKKANRSKTSLVMSYDTGTFPQLQIKMSALQKEGLINTQNVFYRWIDFSNLSLRTTPGL